MSAQMSSPEPLNAGYYLPAWFPERGKKKDNSIQICKIFYQSIPLDTLQQESNNS